MLLLNAAPDFEGLISDLAFILLLVPPSPCFSNG